MQLVINSGFGLVIGTGALADRDPQRVLWGILAAALRFVPYIGAVISAAFPLALAAAVDPGWSMLLWTGLLFVIVEPLVGHVIEPIFHGQSTGFRPSPWCWPPCSGPCCGAPSAWCSRRR